MGISLDEMTKEERTLLLFLEVCSVDSGGRVDIRRMNDADFAKVHEWMKKGYLEWGRVCEADTKGPRCCWVELGDEFWRLAHEERRDRCARILKVRTWRKTKEVNAE